MPERATASAPSFGSPRTIEQLTRTNSLHLTAPGDADWRIPSFPGQGLDEDREDCGPALYGSGPARLEALPSTVLVDPVAESEVLVVSLATEYCRLARLHASPMRRGREWEEPGFVTFFEAGQPIFGSGVGVRIHGNYSRIFNPKNYRFTTREVYGAPYGPGEVIGLPEGTEVRQWVLKRDILWSEGGTIISAFSTSLGWDVARQIGASVPDGRIVSFRLNGQDEGVYFLAQRIDEALLERVLGPGPWEIANEKIDPDADRRLWNWTEPDARGRPQTLPLSKWEAEIDLDSLIRWHLAIIFCLTADNDQATMVRREGDRWQWFNWDMDHSFRGIRPLREEWDVDMIHSVQRNRLNHRSLTLRILANLLTTSDEFRRRYAEVAHEVLDHRITPDFVEGRIEHYSGLAEDFGFGRTRYLKILRTFLENRPDALRRHLDLLLSQPPPGLESGEPD